MASLHEAVQCGFQNRVAKNLKQWVTACLDLCLPGKCSGCGESWLLSDQGYWCEACLERLPWIRSPLCTRCGRPFLKSSWPEDHLCGECGVSDHFFDSARSATQYVGIIRDRIHQLKFGAQLHWVPSLAQLLEMAMESRWTGSVDAIAPVPLHRNRLRQRGFNQSGLLARVLGRRTGIPVLFDVLARSIWTEPQTRLKRQERLQNVRNAFNAVRSSAVEGMAVLLLDDVFTTGSTINECARALKNAGAAKVHALTIARALPDLQVR